MATSSHTDVSFEKSTSKFAYDLFNRIALEQNENIVFSPTSIQSCIGLAFFGATGKTAEEMKKGLYLENVEKSVIEKMFNNLVQSLSASKCLGNANKIYLNNKLHIKQSFNEIATNSFQSEAETINFKENDKAVLTINSWVEMKTGNNIKNLLTSVDPETSMILVNAIHLKAKWQYKFDSLTTHKSDFWVNPNTAIQVDTMINADNYKYANLTDLDATAVGMPYINSDLSMVIILPNQRDGLQVLEKKLKQVDLLCLANQMTVEDVEIFLPKFKIESEFNLNNFLKQMGMTTMFSDQATFNDLLEETIPVKVSEVVHKAFINVDEDGTEAAAATYMKIVPMCLNLNQKNFKVDHPFIYFIQNKDSIYFMGRVTKF